MTELNRLTATAAQQAAGGRRHHLRTADQGLPRPHRCARAGSEGVRPSRCRPCNEAGARGRSRQAVGAWRRTAARPAGRHQGHHRHRRHADPERLRILQGPPAGPRRRLRHARCATPAPIIIGKTVTTELATLIAGPDLQSAQSRPYAGRFVVGLGRRRRRLHVSAGARHPDRRLGDPAGFVLRHLRIEADVRTDLAHRRDDAVAHARHGRRLRPLRRGSGADRRCAVGARPRKTPAASPQPAEPVGDRRPRSRRCKPLFAYARRRCGISSTTSPRRPSRN